MPADEFTLIDWIRQQTPPHPRLTVGIGDDAAVLAWPASNPHGLVVTTDLLMEGTDFLFPSTPAAKAPDRWFPLATPRQVGHKALAVNLSDLAAMAATPVAALLSVALPRHACESLARELYAGFAAIAGEFHVALAGGDTNTWDGPLVISVTLLGEPTGRSPVLRSGAQPGDGIFVTGRLGGSLAGRHLHFRPRVHEARALHAAVDVHALIDLSDGLASDLRHILHASQVGATLDSDAIPIHPDTDRCPAPPSPLERALTDGEDFELLFTLSPADGQRLLLHPPFLDPPITRIGEITSTKSLLLRDRDGRLVPLTHRGYVHPFDSNSDATSLA